MGEHHQQVATTEQFQISAEAAELYESAFVPALFAQWPPRLCRAAGVQHGSHVLDVACGTGIVARTVAGIAGRPGVVGVDLNEAMLAVARRIEPHLEWRRGDVAALPFDDGTFDVVLCQMALMFFPDRRGAFREMARVVAPGGTVSVLVPSALERQAGYGPFVEMAVRHAGPDAAALLGTYFSCGDGAALLALAEQAGLERGRLDREVGVARFPSVDALVATEVDSTPLRDRLIPETYERIRADAHAVLAPFTLPDGRLELPFECTVATADRPGTT